MLFSNSVKCEAAHRRHPISTLSIRWDSRLLANKHPQHRHIASRVRMAATLQLCFLRSSMSAQCGISR